MFSSEHENMAFAPFKYVMAALLILSVIALSNVLSFFSLHNTQDLSLLGLILVVSAVLVAIMWVSVRSLRGLARKLI